MEVLMVFILAIGIPLSIPEFILSLIAISRTKKRKEEK